MRLVRDKTVVYNIIQTFIIYAAAINSFIHGKWNIISIYLSSLIWK